MRRYDPSDLALVDFFSPFKSPTRVAALLPLPFLFFFFLSTSHIHLATTLPLCLRSLVFTRLVSIADQTITTMAPTTLGRSASGGHDYEPFAKGYEAGFRHGWDLGLQRGKEEGRGEAAAQIESRAGDDAAVGGEEARGLSKFLFCCARLPAPAASRLFP